MGSATQWKQDLIIRLLGGDPSQAELAGDINSNISGSPDFNIRQAIRVIKSTYGDDVSISAKAKNLIKFGRNVAVGTTEATLMTLAGSELTETYVSDNLITHISSSSGSDTEPLKVEGHTIDGSGNFTFVVQDVTLAGQTKTALPTPLARATRVYNNGTSDLVGTIYIAEDVTFTSGVPQTDSAIHIMIPAGKNQSEKAATTISNQDYWIITDIHGHVFEKTSSFAEINLQIRRKGKVFREVDDVSAGSGTDGLLNFKQYIIVPPNSDVRLNAIASGANTDVGGSIAGFLAIIV